MPRADAYWVDPDAEDAAPAASDDRWGWVELIVLVQLLGGAALFLPGIQPYRMYVRMLPYVANLWALAYAMRWWPLYPLTASGGWLLVSMALLVANLLHADTHMEAGIAQIVFQICIAAPTVWAARAVRSERALARLLAVIFVASLMSAALGALQVYYPDAFLPPEFSALARSLNPAVVGAMSYMGPGGRLIVRPPGLSDLPGGASVAGLLTVLLGVAYACDLRRGWLVRLCSGCAAVVGMTTLYLTQVRSLTVMAGMGVLMFAAIRLRQGRLLQSGWVIVGGAGLVLASFAWAVAVGGETIDSRFRGIFETGLLVTFQDNRGIFLDYTMRDLLLRFPLGAGLGRWGMMQVYFGDASMWQSPPIHAEIQITGWLLDGGFLMWVCYGGALVAGVRLAYRAALDRSSAWLRDLAAIALVFQLAIIGLCLTGPVFNTQLGMVFWTVTGALYGASFGRRESADVVG